MARSGRYTRVEKNFNGVTDYGTSRRKIFDVMGFISLARGTVLPRRDKGQYEENPEEAIERQERRRARISMEVREALMQTMYRGAIEGWFRGTWWR